MILVTVKTLRKIVINNKNKKALKHRAHGSGKASMFFELSAPVIKFACLQTDWTITYKYSHVRVKMCTYVSMRNSPRFYENVISSLPDISYFRWLRPRATMRRRVTETEKRDGTSQYPVYCHFLSVACRCCVMRQRLVIVTRRVNLRSSQ